MDPKHAPFFIKKPPYEELNRNLLLALEFLAESMKKMEAMDSRIAAQGAVIERLEKVEISLAAIMKEMLMHQGESMPSAMSPEEIIALQDAINSLRLRINNFEIVTTKNMAEIRTTVNRSLNEIKFDLMQKETTNPEEAKFIAEKVDKVSRDLSVLEKMFEAVFEEKIKDSYLVKDEEVVSMVSKMRQDTMRGKVKNLPKWAQEKRKDVIKDLGKRLDDALQILIMKQLAKKQMSMTELSKNIPASSYTIAKTLKKMVSEEKIQRVREGRYTIYSMKD